MTKRKKLLIISAIIFFCFLVFYLSTSELVFNVADFVVSCWPVAEYQKREITNSPELYPYTICKKIKERGLKKLCLLQTQNDDIEINLNSLYSQGASNVDFNEFPCCYSTDVKKNNQLSCDEIKITNDKYYCKALTINPYFCSRITFLNSWTHKVTKSECYQDVALSSWQDPFFCEKTKDRDFCYLRMVTFLVREK